MTADSTIIHLGTDQVAFDFTMRKTVTGPGFVPSVNAGGITTYTGAANGLTQEIATDSGGEFVYIAAAQQPIKTFFDVYGAVGLVRAVHRLVGVRVDLGWTATPSPNAFENTAYLNLFSQAGGVFPRDLVSTDVNQTAQTAQGIDIDTTDYVCLSADLTTPYGNAVASAFTLRFRGKQHVDSLLLPNPYDPTEAPSDTARIRQAVSGKVWSTRLGQRVQRVQRFSRTYKYLTSDKKEELERYFGDTLYDWSRPFVIEDPLIGTVANCFLDRARFEGFTMDTNFTHSCRLHFLVGA